MVQTTTTLDIYTDTLTQKRYVTDLVDYISPYDAPLWEYLGGSNAESKFNIVNLPGPYVEWIEDELRAMTSALTSSCTSDTATIVVDDGEYFRAGDIILIDTETLWVSATSSDNLSVTRGWGSTTGATHASTTEVERVTIAQPEGMAYTASQQVTKTTAKNYTQIFEDTAIVTYRRNRISLYGPGVELDYQVSKLIPQMMRHLEKALYRGISSAGTTAVAPTMDGINALVSGGSNTVSTTATALTEKLMNDAMYMAWSDGGNPKLILTNQWGQRKINSFYEDSVRTTLDENRGGISIQHILTPFGECDVLMDRWCPADKMYFIDPEFIGIYSAQDWMEEPITLTSMSLARRVWGEYTLVLKQAKAHAMVYFSSTT